MSKEDSVNRECLIGVAHVLLEALSEQLENEIDAIILSPEGDVRGTLRVELWPVNKDGAPGIPDEEVLDDLLDSRMVFVLRIPHANGIPPDLANSVRIEYTYFHDEEPQQVPAAIGACTEPEFGYEKTFVQDPVTMDFFKYLQTQSLVFNVYGSNIVTEQMETAGLDRASAFQASLPCEACFIAGTWDVHEKMKGDFIYELSTEGSDGRVVGQGRHSTEKSWKNTVEGKLQGSRLLWDEYAPSGAFAGHFECSFGEGRLYAGIGKLLDGTKVEFDGAKATHVDCEATLFATACNHKVTRAILEGVYHLHGRNFGKPVYKKESQTDGQDAIMFYWDGRDGDDHWGWWIADSLGNDGKAYAFHSDKDSNVPPKQGWHIPFDRSIDATFEISATPTATSDDRKQQTQATHIYCETTFFDTACNHKDCETTLFATACNHKDLRAIIEGVYHSHGQNFGKPVYKKESQRDGLDVIIFYWDSRDGDDNWGWWIAECLGVEGEAYAFHSDRNSNVPPKQGWHIPFDKSIDTTFELAAKPMALGGGGKQQSQAETTPSPEMETTVVYDKYGRAMSRSKFRPIPKNSRTCLVS